MISNVLKYGHLCGCFLLAVTMAALATYRLSLASRQQVLRHQISELVEGIEGLEREHKEFRRVGLRATGLWNASYPDNEAMTKMLRRCKSREEFVVREGPRIAWSELSSSTDRSKKIGIYLPAGIHWLKYSVADSGRLGGIETAQFLRGDPRELPDVVSLELGPEPEVYEFEFKVGDDEFPRISVIGRDNAAMSEATVPLMARPGKKVFARLSKDTFLFPSEFKPNDEERPSFLRPAMPPVCELGLLDVSVSSTGGAAMLRLWIESDARPCMPAIYVAANYDKVTSLRYRHDNPGVINRVTDPDTEFTRLFEPYDGSGTFYFREGIFLKPVRRGDQTQFVPPSPRTKDESNGQDSLISVFSCCLG